MRIDEILTEWRESYLYHSTDIPSAITIWRTDNLRGGTGPSIGRNRFSGVSTTRSYSYALGYLNGNSTENEGGVIFWLDQDLIKRDLGRRRLKGYDWFADNNPDDTSDEFQLRNWFKDTDRAEIVITKGGLSPIRKYVHKIEIWLPKTFDREPLPLNATERERFEWQNKIGNYSYNPNYPDRGKINIRSDEEKISRYLRDPMDKKAWEAMIKDPRADIKLGLPQTHLGKYVYPRKQYDYNHPMFNRSR